MLDINIYWSEDAYGGDMISGSDKHVSPKAEKKDIIINYWTTSH